MAKRFFYVCAGLLMLACAYHLGASSAGAEAANNVSIAHIGDSSQKGAWAVVFDRVVVASTPGSEVDPLRVAYVTDPVPGSSPIVAVSGEAKSVILANGDVYRWSGTWSHGGNLLANMVAVSSPAPAPGLALEVGANPTWGNISVSYLVGIESSEVHIELLDARGQVIQQQTEYGVPPGKHYSVISLDTRDRTLAPGTYVVRISVGAQVATTKAFILKR
jgi:hypothetical protein